MNPVILNIYGPLAIHAYGLCIAIGSIITFFLMSRDQKLQQLISIQELLYCFQLTLFAGYFGGRIFYMLSETEPTYFLFLFKFWEPGLSILGAILSSITTLIAYFYINQKPILILFDRFAIYAPLIQSFGRIGCFFAGCCFGTTTSIWWSIVYQDPNHMAPLHVSLHPTQLYSSFLLMSIFVMMYVYLQYHTKTPGILFCLYLLLAGSERFFIDFMRGDRIISHSSWMSVHQLISLFMMLSAIFGIIILTGWIKKLYGPVSFYKTKR